MTIESLTEMRGRLGSAGNIRFTDHAKEKIRKRKISEKLITDNIKNPKNLKVFSFEKDKYPGEKYELYFCLNKRKTLKIVVSFLEKDLNVVTSHIILSKRLKWVEKWRKKHI